MNRARRFLLASPLMKYSFASLGHAFRALRNRAFLVYWLGQLVSVTGTWMQTMALSWLVYRLTDSALSLGVLAAARFGPALVGAPVAGVLADRLPRRRLVLTTQALAMLQAGALALLTVSGAVQLWHIFVLALFQGVVDTVDMPARQTLQLDIVTVADLQSAVSLNAAAFNGARMVGPALAGVLVATVGEGVCFALNAASYVAVLVALASIPIAASEVAAPASLRNHLLEGVRFAWGEREVRAALLAVIVTSVFGLSYLTLLPVFARDVLRAGPQGYGMLLAGAGLGAMAGALLPAARRRAEGARRSIVAGQAVLGLGLVALGVTRHLVPATVWMVVVGVAVAVQLSTTNGYLQTAAPLAMRGRVVSLYIWIFVGLAPVGGFMAGAVAEIVGAPSTAIAAGVVCVVAAVAGGGSLRGGGSR